MHHGDSESSSRKLVWVKGSDFARLGCSECDWVFAPSSLIQGDSLDELVQRLNVQLSNEFVSHVCAEHPSKSDKMTG